MLFRSKAKHPDDRAILGDATCLPFADGSVDFVQLVAVSHHLTDDQFTGALTELRRVLKPGGGLVLADPVWNPRRVRGKILWRMDRGSYPRPPQRMREIIRPHFEIKEWDGFAIHHECVIAVLH